MLAFLATFLFLHLTKEPMGHPGLFPGPDLQGTSVSYVYKEAGGEGL